jgi:hypothetical protein
MRMVRYIPEYEQYSTSHLAIDDSAFLSKDNRLRAVLRVEGMQDPGAHSRSKPEGLYTLRMVYVLLLEPPALTGNSSKIDCHSPGFEMRSVTGTCQDLSHTVSGVGSSERQ